MNHKDWLTSFYFQILVWIYALYVYEEGGY